MGEKKEIPLPRWWQDPYYWFLMTACIPSLSPKPFRCVELSHTTVPTEAQFLPGCSDCRSGDMSNRTSSSQTRQAFPRRAATLAVFLNWAKSLLHLVTSYFSNFKTLSLQLKSIHFFPSIVLIHISPKAEPFPSVEDTNQGRCPSASGATLVQDSSWVFNTAAVPSKISLPSTPPLSHLPNKI